MESRRTSGLPYSILRNTAQPSSTLGRCAQFKGRQRHSVSEQLEEPLGKELSDSRTGLKSFPFFTPFLLRTLQEKTSCLSGGEEDWPFNDHGLKPHIHIPSIKKLSFLLLSLPVLLLFHWSELSLAYIGVSAQQSKPADISLGLIFPEQPIKARQGQLPAICFPQCSICSPALHGT